AEALHMMGVLALQVGKPAAAVELISTAIRHQPNSAGFHSNLGTALRRLGRLDEAIAAGRRAVALDGDFVDALINLSNALSEKGGYEEAVPLLKKIIRLRPQVIDQRLLLARALI
ncbi:tetratricopeptide repeat protein, partial [bacterium]|nr:tetratricopeptide repeat protein [bacterium]